MNDNVVFLYFEQWILLFINVLFCVCVIRQKRFSPAKTGLLASLGFLILYLPQFLFPGFFLTGAALTKTGFLFHSVYWIFCIGGQYVIYFLLSRRDWLKIFFLSVLLDIIMSIFVGIVLAILQSFSISLFDTESFRLILFAAAGILTVPLLRLVFFNRLHLKPWMYKLVVLLYCLGRLALTLLHFQATGPRQQSLLLYAVLSTLLGLCLLIMALEVAVSLYEKKLCQKLSRTSDADLELLYENVNAQCQSKGILLHFPKSEIPTKPQALLYILFLTYKYLFCFASAPTSNQKTRIYFSVFYRFDCIFICAGCTGKFSGKRIFPFILSSLYEILLDRLLYRLGGRIEHLDETKEHKQVRIICPLSCFPIKNPVPKKMPHKS